MWIGAQHVGFEGHPGAGFYLTCGQLGSLAKVEEMGVRGSAQEADSICRKEIVGSL